MSALALSATLVGLAGCSSTPREPQLVAAYRAPEIPPECRQQVYDNPEVRELLVPGTAVPTFRAENQYQLAFRQDEALRRCLRDKRLLPQGGVEPVRHLWYPSLF